MSSTGSVALSQVVELSPTNKPVAGESALQVYQRCVRVWAGVLTPFEFMIALHIIDRTIGWQKTRVAVSTSRMRDGDTVYQGMNIGKTAFFAALASLEAKGVIARHPHPEGKLIRVYSVNLGWTPAMLNVPKRLKSGSLDEPYQFAKRTVGVREANTRESNLGEGSPDKEDYVAGKPTTAIRTADELVRAAKDDRQQRVAAGRASPSRTPLAQTVGDAQGSWRAAIEETSPTGLILGWSQREIAIVKAKAKNWQQRDRISFPDFIGWCAANWSSVCATQLKWMTKSPPPKAPTIGFLMSFIDQFAECWASGDLDRWMNEDQRSQYERLRAKGRKHDEALHEMAKSDAVEVMRKDNERIRREAAIESSISRRRLQQAEKLEQFGGVPVHPRSLAAEEARKAAQQRVALVPPAPVATSPDDLEDNPFPEGWEPSFD